MRRPARPFVVRLAGAAAASGLALAGLVAAAWPGERGGLLRLDRGDRGRRHGRLDQHQVRLGRPVSALALTAAGFSVDYPQQ